MAGDSEFQRPITGSFTAAGQSFDITSPDQATEILQFSGTWVGIITIEGSNDGITYYPVVVINSSNNLPTLSISSNGLYIGQTNGYQYLRARSFAWTSGTGTFNVYGSDSATLTSSISIIRGGSDGTTIGNTGGSLHTTDGILPGGTQGNLSLPTANTAVEVKVGASRLTNRKMVTLMPLDGDMFWGYSNSVTTSTGTPIFKNQLWMFEVLDDTAQIWLVCASSSKNARISETP